MRAGGKAPLPNLAIWKTARVEDFCLLCCVGVVFRDSGKDREAVPTSSSTAPVSQAGISGVMPASVDVRKRFRQNWRCALECGE